MKKSIWTVLLTALVALVAVGCAKEADLSGLKEKVDGLDKRVTALEQAVEKLNKETVPGLENLVNALNKKLTISSIVEGDGEYTIRFSDGTEATIKNGKDGKDGLDAEAPEVSITKGEDGIYYWTVNGELLKDGEGKPIPVTGKGDKGDKGDQGDKGDKGDKGEDGEDGADGADGADGNDGITPLFGTNNEGKLIVSYDGGQTWSPIGLNVIDGSSFTSAYIDDAKSTEDYIVLVVGDTEVQIPREKTFALKIKYEGDLSSVGANAGETLAIEYTVQGVTTSDEVTVDILSATPGITAKIAKIDAASGYIMISVPAADPEAATPAKIEGKIFVFADNNKGKTNIKVITLEEGTITAVANVDAQAPAAGGEFELTVTTNKEYNVNINDAAASWLSVVETKATHTDKLTIVAAKNETGAYRVGTVTINDRNSGDEIAEYTVVQQPSGEVATDLASIRTLEDGTEVAANGAVVLAASKEGVLVADENGGYIYVYLGVNPAVERGDLVSFKGVKQTNEKTAVKYVDASKGEVVDDDYQGEIPDLSVYPMRYHYSYQSINSGVTGLLKKGDAGYYLDVLNYSDYFPNVAFETPLTLDLEPLVGKYVTAKGYTNGSYVEYDDDYYFTEASFVDFIVNSVEEVTFAVNPNWTLSYEGEVSGLDIVKNTVAAGSDDYYFNYEPIIIPKSKIEGTLEDAVIVNSLSLSEIVQYWFYYYRDTIDDDATKDSYEFESDRLDYGEYVALAVGLNEDGFVSGKYAYVEFEKVDPHVHADYSDFLGKWNAGGELVEITQNEEGVSYYFSAPGVEKYGAALAYYDSEAGVMYVDEQKLENTGNHATYGPLDYYLSGFYYYSANYPSETNYPVDADEPTRIFTAAKLTDGTIDLVPGSFENKYRSGSLVGFAYTEIITSGQYKGYMLTNGSIVSLPSTLEEIKVSEEYNKWLGDWGFYTTGVNVADSLMAVVSIKEKVAGATYSVENLCNTTDQYGAQFGIFPITGYFSEEDNSLSVLAEKTTLNCLLTGNIYLGPDSGYDPGYYGIGLSAGSKLFTASLSSDNEAKVEGTTYNVNGPGLCSIAVIFFTQNNSRVTPFNFLPGTWKRVVGEPTSVPNSVGKTAIEHYEAVPTSLSIADNLKPVVKEKQAAKKSISLKK